MMGGERATASGDKKDFKGFNIFIFLIFIFVFCMLSCIPKVHLIRYMRNSTTFIIAVFLGVLTILNFMLYCSVFKNFNFGGV
jgi:hypothetical protein